jgi:hypothetical protein
MDVNQLVIITEFLRIHEEEGEEAAILWAEMQEAMLEARELSRNKPDLRIVGS